MPLDRGDQVLPARPSLVNECPQAVDTLRVAELQQVGRDLGGIRRAAVACVCQSRRPGPQPGALDGPRPLRPAADGPVRKNVACPEPPLAVAGSGLLGLPVAAAELFIGVTCASARFLARRAGRVI